MHCCVALIENVGGDVAGERCGRAILVVGSSLDGWNRRSAVTVPQILF